MKIYFSTLLRKENRSFFTIIIGFSILIISAIAFPYYQSYVKNNWESYISQKFKKQAQAVQSLFDNKQKELLNNTKYIEAKIKNILAQSELSLLELQDHLLKISLINKYKKFSFEILNHNFEIIAWSDYKFTDFSRHVLDDFQINKNNFHTYLTFTKKIELENSTFYLITRLEIESNYHIKNKFIENISLEKTFSEKFETKVSILWDTLFFSVKPDLLSNSNDYIIPIKFLDNKTAFYLIAQKPDKDLYLSDLSNSYGNFQKIIFLFLLSLLIISLFKDFRSIQSRFLQALVFTILIWFFRIVLLILNFPAFLLKGEIVNPSIYASRFLFGLVRSPLELILTSTTLTINLIIILILFRFYLLERKTNSKEHQHKVNYFYLFIGLIFIVITPFVLRGFGASFRSFIYDSTIRFFESSELIPDLAYLLMYYSVFITGISLVLYLIFVIYILNRVFDFHNNSSIQKRFIIISLLLIAPALIFYFLDKSPQFEPLTIILLVLIVTFTTLISLKEESILTFRIAFLILVTSSFFSSIMIYQKNEEQEKDFQKTIAFELLKPREHLINFALNQTLQQASTDAEISKLFFIEASTGFSNYDFNFLSYRIWINSILSDEGLNSYLLLFDKYGNQIGSFGFGMVEPDFIRNYFNPMLVENLAIFLIKDRSPNDLFGVIPIRFNNLIVGYCGVVIELSESIFQPIVNNTLFKNIKYEKNPLKLLPDAAVYIYRNSQLELIHGEDFPATRDLDFEMINEYLTRGQNEIWIKEKIDGNDYRTFYFVYYTNNPIKLISISIPEETFILTTFKLFKISLVHIIISALTLMIGILILVFRGYRFKLKFKTRLFAGLFVITLIPIVLLAYFTRNSELQRWKKDLSDELKKDLDIASLSFSDKSKNNQRNFPQIFELAEKLGIDFNIYSNADLIFSTQKKLYNIEFFRKSLSAKAYNDLIIERKNYTFYFEFISNYQFLVGYKKIDFDNSYFIISIPTIYRHEQIIKELAQIDTFIFGAYSLTLILIFFFGNLIFERLTKPISELTEATKKVSSGDLKVKLEQKESGEVGDLIEAFNRMISDLEESRKNLAKVEREQAWKEMAKQVAHEIKNPLTPMKLSLQHLQYLYKSNRREFAKIFGKVSTTLIDQIETLTKITNEFSHFARIPEKTITVCKLEEILNEIINLFSSQVNIQFEFLKNESFHVNADREELKRVFINLIKNSIQASSSQITIKLYKDVNFCFINIEDNGTGIPEEVLDKIFDPNFSTKMEGTGLGLSIVKRILNDINGTIEIKSEVGKGTIVMISIPHIKEETK